MDTSSPVSYSLAQINDIYIQKVMPICCFSTQENTKTRRKQISKSNRTLDTFAGPRNQAPRKCSNKYSYRKRTKGEIEIIILIQNKECP